MSKNLPTTLPPALTTRRNRQSAWIVLAVGLIITVATTLAMKAEVDRRAEQEFTFSGKELQNKITNRLFDHARILQSGVAFFDAAENVSREQWQIFTHEQKFEEQLPGIQGIGFALLVPRGELTRHLQEIRQQGFPGYQIFPAGERDLYSAIIYLEPFSGRNLRAFGYDMLTEPVRRAAMEQARDANAAVLSGKVLLVQETGIDDQDGFLMYLPVYRQGLPIATLAERRTAIYGWVYSPYRMNNLMQGILGRPNPLVEKKRHLQLFTGGQTSSQNLLYECHLGEAETFPPAKSSTRELPIDFYGQRWTLRLTQSASSLTSEQYIKVWLTLIGGTAITLLLFALIRTLLNTRAVAQRIAAKLTADLKESEEFTTAILDSLTAEIAVLDPEGSIVATNKSWRVAVLAEKDFTTSGTALGQQLLAGCRKSSNEKGDDWAEKINLGIRAVLIGKEEKFTLDYPCHTPDEECWFSLRVTQLQGSRHGVVVALTDISERKRAETLLHRANTYNRRLIEASLDPLVTIGKDGNITDVNQATEAVTGLSRWELIGSDFSCYFSDQKRATAGYRQVFQDGIVRDFPLEIRHRDGHLTPVLYNASLYKDEKGEDEGIFAAARDISVRKEIEVKLSQSAIDLQEAQRIAKVGSWAWDIATDTITWSEEYYRIYGFDPTQPPPGYEDHLKAYTPESAAKLDAAVKSNMQSGEAYEIELELAGRAEPRRWITARSESIRDAQGNIFGLRGTAQDITEQKQLAEALKSATAQAEAANRAKSEFLTNMSHEIRTPMNGVIGVAQLLEMTELTQEQQEYVAGLKLSGHHLLSLINDILDLAKIEAHRIELEAIDFDLQAETQETVKLLSPGAEGKGLKLVTLIDAEGPLLFTGDAGRLRQILTNLISNAIKFTEKGSVTLHVQKEDEDEGSATLRFMIRDTGIGIAADKLEIIFEPFTQANGSTNRIYGGTGLGLTIARQLVELMGGSIGVESAKEEGSTFWFTVKLKKQSGAGTTPGEGPLSGDDAEAPLPKGATGNNARLLLAEDEPTTQMVMKAILTKSGYRVDVANNGSEAIMALEANDYALVLMDCMMPVLDGFVATAIIRDPTSKVRDHAIPVIALTAKAFKDDRDKCRAAGMDDYLSKPVDVAELRTMLAKWVAQPST